MKCSEKRKLLIVFVNDNNDVMVFFRRNLFYSYQQPLELMDFQELKEVLLLDTVKELDLVFLEEVDSEFLAEVDLDFLAEMELEFLEELELVVQVGLIDIKKIFKKVVLKIFHELGFFFRIDWRTRFGWWCFDQLCFYCY